MSSSLPTEKLADWPAHYYELTDIDLREACLLHILKEQPDSEDNKIRLMLLRRRFGSSREAQRILDGAPHRRRAPRPDAFLRAFILLKAGYHRGSSLLNRKREKAEFREHMRALCAPEFWPEPFYSAECCLPLLYAEWEDLARCFIGSCARDSSYRSALFGMISVSEESMAERIRSEILLVCEEIPQQFSAAEALLPLRDIMLRVHETYFPDRKPLC